MSSYSLDLRDLLEAGCHFGHQARRWNPKMKPYIYTDRDGIHIFDLGITAEKLVAAMEFVRDYVASGKDIVFVGTKRQAAAILREEAGKVGAPFVDVRWLGGTLTNWEEMSKRIRRLKDLKEQREKGDLKSYTKKERVLIDREIAKLERFFGGIATYTSRPEALFVVDTHREITAVKEANMIGAPVVGMVDTNGDPDMVKYVIPVNDDAVRSIKLVVTKIAEAYAEGKALRGKAPVSNQPPVVVAGKAKKPEVKMVVKAPKPAIDTAVKKPAVKKLPTKKVETKITPVKKETKKATTKKPAKKATGKVTAKKREA